MLQPPKVIFRASIGVVLIKPETDQIFAFELRKVPGTYKFIQGGVELTDVTRDRLFEEVKREAYEEAGIREKDLFLLATYPEWLVYVCPEERRSAKVGFEQIGQNQMFFFCLYNGTIDSIELSSVNDKEQEFTSVTTMSFAGFLRCCDKSFLDNYRKLAQFALDKNLYYRSFPLP